MMLVRRLLLASFCLLVLMVPCGRFSSFASLPGGRLSDSQNPAYSFRIWAWERDRDLRFIQGGMPIANYAGTIVIRNERAFWRPRLQKLQLPGSVSATPVVRIENLCQPNQSLSKSLNFVVSPISELVSRGNYRRVQIDFDARESERGFYVELMRALRKRLPAKTEISITALASWCLHEAWIKELHADEAIVMLFSMGGGGNQILKFLEHQKLHAGNSKLSIGISANERITNRRLKELGLLNGDCDIYVFNSLPWTETRLEVLQREIFE